MSSLSLALQKAGRAVLPAIEPSFDVVFRVRRCYNAGSEAEAAFQKGMARIVKAFRLGHINEEQAARLAAML